ADAVALLEGQQGRADDARHGRYLARAHLNLGTVLRASGERGPARASYERALAVLAAMTARWPRVPAYRHEQAAAHNDLGNLLGVVLSRQEKWQEARRHFEAAGSHLREALKPNPDNPDYRLPLRDSYRNLAESLLRLGDRRGAASAALSLAQTCPDVPLDAY